MTKPDGTPPHVAVCEVWTNPAGWELRLMMDGQNLPVTTVVRSHGEMRTLIESWKAALRETGWRKPTTALGHNGFSMAQKFPQSAQR